MSLLTIFLFVLGFMLLIIGADVLVRGASRLAVSFGITPLVVGLTVVAFGTSAPELAASLQATLSGQPDIALGNVVGSNIVNVLVVLGVAALIAPLLVSRQIIRLDVPIMIAASVLVYLFSLNGVVSRWEGILLFAGIVAYTVFSVRLSRLQSAAEQQAMLDEAELDDAPPLKDSVDWIKNSILVLIGLALLVLGARWLVNGAVELARLMGISELMIGLTIVAVGTSMPEIATSVVAAMRKQQDIAVGNAVGSNIFNILGVLGVSSALSPSGVAVSPAALAFDLPVMVAVALACLPIFFTGYRIDRWEGGLFVACYAAYVAYLLLQARQPEMLGEFNAVLWLVLPLIAVTLAVLAGERLRKG
jgi:cation:H+ antiporter